MSDLTLEELERELGLDIEDARSESKDDIYEMFKEVDLSVILVRGTLKYKLLHGEGNFAINDNSTYMGSTWSLPSGKHRHPNNIKFDRSVLGSNELKRALIFHMLPENAFMGNIRSYRTTTTAANQYSILEKYIFTDNYLDAAPESLRAISAPLINKALDKAREQDKKSHYFILFKFVMLWTSLSNHDMIPDELKLKVTLSELDTVERKQDVVHVYTGSMESWVAFSEEDLEQLMDYALFWTEKALPELLKAKDFVLHNDYTQNKGTIYRNTYPAAAEAALSITIDGRKVMKPSIKTRTYDGRTSYITSWRRSYNKAMDRVRNSIFILLALITGARKSELATLRDSDIFKDKVGDYWINITRWKTSKDPNYHGDTEALPLPKFIGEIIERYAEAQTANPEIIRPYLFQANESYRKVENATPGLINILLTQLNNEIPVERLHPHRFRKTIAEILINRDERNIELIRALFGHKSYAMTLQYIARNPLMVRAVAIAIEQSYTKDFHELIAEIKYGRFSGTAGSRIAEQVTAKPHEFTGGQMRTSVLLYVSHLLKAGEPIFIRRTAVGTYCVTGEDYTPSNLPPCIEQSWKPGQALIPNPGNCQVDCSKLVLVEKAKKALVENIAFYSAILENPDNKLNAKTEHELERRVAASKHHLNNLMTNRLQLPLHTDSGHKMVGAQPKTNHIIVRSGDFA
ncbi:hypothetical protein CU666_21935 [Pseudomonas syringae pv. actinidifoliorum]|nr:hypothetical protein [Pseudomonas syringae pv. actinidifoliorum]